MNDFLSLMTDAQAIFWVIIFFGGSIFIHELGHFLAARYYGLRVERFSIGFGPKIIKWQGKETEYCISLFPLGGYVALPELTDLSSIEGPYKRTPSKKTITYQARTMVLLMGAIFNILFALFLATILYFTGQPAPADEATTMIGYIPQHLKDANTPSPALAAGLKAGDTLLMIDGHSVKAFSDIEQFIAIGTHVNEHNQPQAHITFLREGVVQDTTAFPALINFNEATGETLRVLGIAPASTIKIAKIIPNSPAEKAGLLENDTLTHLNNEPLYSLLTLSEHLNQNPNSPITLTIKRNQEQFPITLIPESVPYTQLSLKISLLDDPTAHLIFIPKSKQPPHELIKDNDPLEHLILFKKQEGLLGTRFQELSIGDKWIGFSNTIGIESLNQTLATFKYSTTPLLELLLKNETEGIYFWRIPENTGIEIIPSQTMTMLGFVQDTSPITLHLSPWEQVKKSIQMTFNVLKSLISPTSNIHLNNLMGPPGIMRVLHTFSSIDIRLVMGFTVLLNINLAILNLLPLPILDGGQIAFATINRFRRTPLSPRFVRGLQEIFILLLFGMMIYVSFFDIRRWKSDHDSQKQNALNTFFYVEPEFKK